MIICANCGAKLKDDQLLCEVCGTEVSLVPEFEPLIEDRITKSLSALDITTDFEEYTGEINPIGSSLDSYEPFEEEESYEELPVESLEEYEEYKDSAELLEVSDFDLLEDFESVAFTENLPEITDTSVLEPYDEAEEAEDSLIKAFHVSPKNPKGKREPKKEIPKETKEEIKEKPVKEIKSQKEQIEAFLKDDKNFAPVQKDLPILDHNEFEELDDLEPFEEYSLEDYVPEKPKKTNIAGSKKNKEKREKKDKSTQSKRSFALKLPKKKVQDEFDPDDDFGDFDDDIHIFRFIFEFIRDSKYRWVAIALLLVCVIFIIVGVKRFAGNVVQNSSATYHADLARGEAGNGNYVGAIAEMEEAIKLAPEDDGLKFELSNYYFELGQDDSALIQLKIIIGAKGAGYSTAYAKLVNYYAERGEYEKITENLKGCTDEAILALYGDYVANAPVFPQAEGTYEDSISIEILCPGNGKVYYTTDGSEPTTQSDVYYGPITMDLGIYHVKAMYVNPFGIQSETVSKTYTVDIRTPSAPDVFTVEGNYEYPRLIYAEAQKGCDLYYTTDNTLPTRLSNKYEGPIPMPVGTSHYLFVAYTAEGVAGDITEVTYHLNIDSELDFNQVVTNLYAYDYLSGRAFDIEGHLPGNSTRYDYKFSYACTYGVTFPDIKETDATLPTVKTKDIYFVVIECLVDSMGKESKTGNVYFVNADDGSMYLAGKNTENKLYSFIDDNGNMLVSSLISPESYTISPDLLGTISQVEQDMADMSDEN